MHLLVNFLVTGFNVCGEKFEKISEAFLTGFACGHVVVLIQVHNIIESTVELDVESSKGPRTVGLVLIVCLVADTVVVNDIVLPAGEKKGSHVFMLDRFLFGLNLKDSGPFVEFIVEPLPVPCHIVRGFGNFWEFLLEA